MCKAGAIATDGFCTQGTASVTGAFPGLAKTEAYYSGGPSDGGGTLVYRTAHLYDAHRRPAAVVTKNAAGKIILASTYAYDQYDNLTRETSLSQLDTSDTSNYQVTYGYDGLLRLISAVREDLDGNLIRSLSYEYDAASNLTKKVEVTPDEDA
jgi:YD repeat-containing protein